MLVNIHGTGKISMLGIYAPASNVEVTAAQAKSLALCKKLRVYNAETGEWISGSTDVKSMLGDVSSVLDKL